MFTSGSACTPDNQKAAVVWRCGSHIQKTKPATNGCGLIHSIHDLAFNPCIRHVLPDDTAEAYRIEEPGHGQSYDEIGGRIEALIQQHGAAGTDTLE